jgi:hypothetical protein
LDDFVPWFAARELPVPAHLLTATKICGVSVFAVENTLLNIVRITKISEHRM